MTAESAEIVTTSQQLVDFFARGERPRNEWLIGCEHEKFAYRLLNLKPVSYEEADGLRVWLMGMQDFGWTPLREGENIIGLSRGRSMISLEPGGQVRLMGAPLRTLHETSAEVDQHLVEACEVGEHLAIGFLGMGFHPTAKQDDIPWAPKARYRIMRNYMPKRGPLALDAMLRTCSSRVSFNYGDEQDMVKKFRVAMALQPVATALFASSPFTEGKPNGYLSYRMHCRANADPDRGGFLPFVFEDGFDYARYVEYALDVPMLFVLREGKLVECAGQSFRDFVDGKLEALPDARPTIGDWVVHLTNIFPDVRLKKVLEMRGADSGSPEMLLALPAFWTGIMYDPAALEAAWDLVKEWTPDERQQLHIDAPKLGFQAEIGGHKAMAVAHEAIILAQQGLRRRANRLHGGADETRYLDVLLNFTESGQSRADQFLMQANHFPNFSMKDLFDMGRLRPPEGHVVEDVPPGEEILY